jgi:HIV Tat-specific factor 1
MASSQAAAAMVDNEVDEFMTQGGYNASEAPLVDQANDVPNRKRKLEQSNEVSNIRRLLDTKMLTCFSQAAKKPKVQENRAIFVSNLPLDTNENEIEEVFSKYGIIDQGADGNKRIKMYYKDDKFTGEALIVYFKQASIALAIQMMDDYWFRIEEQTNGTITVKEADYSYKRNTDSEQIVSKLTRKDKKASERNRADLNR